MTEEEELKLANEADSEGPGREVTLMSRKGWEGSHMDPTKPFFALCPSDTKWLLARFECDQRINGVQSRGTVGLSRDGEQLLMPVRSISMDTFKCRGRIVTPR